VLYGGIAGAAGAAEVVSNMLIAAESPWQRVVRRGLAVYPHSG
jgi:alkylated DNA nucleotide flippase Atl1